MAHMQRTHIVLPEDLKQRVRLRAARDKKSLNQVIRELVEKGLEEETTSGGGDALLGLAKLRLKGPTDFSSNLDKYLYEESK